MADIAGGGGVLSFELHVRHGIPCTLVDPRYVGLSPRQLNTWRNLRKRGAMAGEGSAEYTAWLRADQWVRVAAAEDELRQRQHLQRVLANTDGVIATAATAGPETEEAEVGAVASKATMKVGEIEIEADRRLAEATAAAAPSAFSTPSGSAVAEAAKRGGALFRHIPSEFWGDVDGPVGRDLADCDVLVGMHPDQATEPIVDAALAMGKPFAVVPCCVFPAWVVHSSTTTVSRLEIVCFSIIGVTSPPLRLVQTTATCVHLGRSLSSSKKV